MRILTMITCFQTLLSTYNLSIYHLRKDKTIIKEILKLITLIIMILFSYLCLHNLLNKYTLILNVVVNLYILVSFMYMYLKKKTYITVLSVKKSIDMSNSGILFLNKDKEVMLINNKMKDILNDLKIETNYLENLKNKSFRKLEDNYLIKSLNDIWKLNIKNDLELTLTNITEIYKLRELEEEQNKMLEENNLKIINTINNIETLEKEKNILKIKNEYHDLLGHHLSLFISYLDQNKKDVKDINYLLDSICNNKHDNDINKLIKMYSIVGINIILNGRIPKEKYINNILFEIIRESITNAIIHADSKNINININECLDKIDMSIINDGKKPNIEIHENEGIRGMRRKLSNINGSLKIETADKFILKVTIKRS